MDINGQKWLKLSYSLQINKSNAVSNPKSNAKEIDCRKVYKTVIRNPEMSWQYVEFYYVEPMRQMPEYRHLTHYVKYPLTGGGASKKLTEEQEQQVRVYLSAGMSGRGIARLMGVSEATIRRVGGRLDF